VLCTANGAVTNRQLPRKGHQKQHGQCCTMACRAACGATPGGIVPVALAVALPASIEAPAKPARIVSLYCRPAEASPAQPRAPPFA
jgi:hypothetical protein